MKEETMPFAGTRTGGMNIEDSAVRDNLNVLLAGMTSGKFVTPYIALERVAKTLANFHIFLPAQSFLEGDSGTMIVPINQYGIKIGMNNASTFIKKGEVGKDFTHGPHVEGEDNELNNNQTTDMKYTVFFEYRMSDCGMFMVFCEVVDEEELDEILADLEAELNDEGEEEEEKDELDEMVDLSKVTMNKNTGNISSKDNKVDLSKVIMNKNTGKLSSMKEEKFTNRAPSENPHGNLDAAKKEMNKPKPVPSRSTKDLDQMNRDSEGNTVVEEEDVAKKAMQTYVRRKKTDAIMANKKSADTISSWNNNPIKTAFMSSGKEVMNPANAIAAGTKYSGVKNKYDRTFGKRRLKEEVSYIVKNRKTKEVISTHAKEDDARKKRDEIGTKDQYGIFKQRHAGALKNRKS